MDLPNSDPYELARCIDKVNEALSRTIITRVTNGSTDTEDADFGSPHDAVVSEDDEDVEDFLPEDPPENLAQQDAADSDDPDRLKGPPDANEEDAQDDTTTADSEPEAEDPSCNRVGAPGPSNDKGEPTADRFETLIHAAGRIGSDAERKSLAQNLAAFGSLHPTQVEKLDTRNWDRLDADVKGAASAIWKEAADIVARAVTDLNQRRQLLDALADWRDDPIRETFKAEVRHRHPLAAWFWDAMKDLAADLLKEMAKEMLIEMLFPGSHLIFPPTGLIDALFTAGAFGELAGGGA